MFLKEKEEGRTGRKKNHHGKEINNNIPRNKPRLSRGLINCLINLTDVKHVPCKDLSKPLSFYSPPHVNLPRCSCSLASNGENPRDRLELSVATQPSLGLLKRVVNYPPSASHFFPGKAIVARVKRRFQRMRPRWIFSSLRVMTWVTSLLVSCAKIHSASIPSFLIRVNRSWKNGVFLIVPPFVFTITSSRRIGVLNKFEQVWTSLNAFEPVQFDDFHFFFFPFSSKKEKKDLKSDWVELMIKTRRIFK